MKTNLKDFFEKLTLDETFKEKFARIREAHEAYEKAKPYLQDISFEEFKDGMIKIQEEFRHNKSRYKLKATELKNAGGGTATSNANFDHIIDILDAFGDDFLYNM